MMKIVAMIEQVTGVLKENAESKFVSKNDVDDKRIRTQIWGYRERAIFYLLPKAFKEICNGFDDAAKSLVEEGLLIPDGQGKNSRSVRIPAHYNKKDRFYVINLEYKNEEIEDA